MRRITVSLDADIVIEAMVLVGTRDPQDAVEVVVRDYIERSHRTEAVTGTAADESRKVERKPPTPEAG